MRFVVLAVVAWVLAAGCSDQRTPVAGGAAEVGYTGLDQSVAEEGFLEASESVEDDSAVGFGVAGKAAEGGSGKLTGTKLFPIVLQEMPSAPREGSLGRVMSLGAAEAVKELHSLGFKGQDVCDGSPPDYAEVEEPTYAVVTDENAVSTASDVAEAVWKYYAIVARTHEQPTPQGLLCIAQITIQPKLNWKWADLRDLISGEASLSYLMPEEVHVAGLMAGNALAVACLPPRAYGELSLDDAPIATTLLLRWAGDRWRVSVAEDFEAEDLSSDGFCEQHLSAVRAEFADDIADTGERWRFGEWRFTADELREIASVTEGAFAEGEEEVQQ